MEFRTEGNIHIVTHEGRELYRGESITDAEEVMNDFDASDDGTELDQ